MALHYGGRGPGHLSRWPKAAGEVAPPAPTLTSPTGTATGAETADLSVSTNEGNGTLYWYVSESATPPSAADLKAGTGAADAGSQAVTATGTQTASADGLTAETAYYAHFLHRDAAGNDSAIVTSAGFETEAGTVTPTPTADLDVITDHNITWNLASAVPVGQYVSGDYFAMGGVVASTVPACEQVDGSYDTDEPYTGRWVHGAMVDPGRDGGTGAAPAQTPQGWDSLPKAASVTSATEFDYDHAKNADPGATGSSISGPASIVKAKSILVDVEADSRTKLSDSSLLTLVDTIPPKDSFRRWAGATSKTPIFFASDIDWAALPTITLPTGATLPSASTLINKLGPLHTYMNNNLYARGTNPINQQSQYGADIANDVQQAMLFTMTDGVSEADRKAVAYKLIQNGLDVYDALEAGRRWSSPSFSFGGGMQWIKVLVVYAAALMRNAANADEAAKLLGWVDGTTNKIFADDMMVFAISREHIDSSTSETQNTRYWPVGVPDWSENSIEWLSKPSSNASLDVSWDVAYRTINGYPFLTSALIARLLGMEGDWNNPQFFEYCDTYYNKWQRRSAPSDGYFYDFCRRNVAEYYTANSPAFADASAPTLVRRASNSRYAWIEANEPFDLTYQPAAADIAVSVDSSPASLASVSTTASGAISSGTSNRAKPIITVASATGIRIGQRIECASLPPDMFVTSVSGTSIGISGYVPATFSNQTITFHNVFVFDRSLVAVLPTPLAGGEAVTIGYSAPGSGYVRNLGGVSLGTIASDIATNHTGELPEAATTKAVLDSQGQVSKAPSPPSEAVKRLCISLRFWLASKAAGANILAAYNASTSTFRWYQASASDLRMLIQGQQFRMPGSNAEIPANKLVTAHIIIDLTATSYDAIYRGILRWEDEEYVLPTTGSTGALDGSTVMDIATITSQAICLGASGTGTGAIDGGWSELIMRWGGAGLILPTDFSGGGFAAGADWGGNGENVWGEAPQLYYAGSVDEWNSGVINRGRGGARSMQPNIDPDTGDLIQPYTEASL